jgi:hypothetical protein
MTDKEILATAESVGLLNDCLDVETISFCILAFAKQIAKLEREACAKVCDALHKDWKWRAAESIRARGEA